MSIIRSKQEGVLPFSKELPFSIEAERSVLSSLLLNVDSYDQVADILSIDEFYYRPHRIIYQAICEFNAQGKNFDLLVLHDHLLGKNLLDKVGGVPYLMELQQNVYSLGFLAQHAKIVKDKALLRCLITSCTEIVGICYEPKGKEVAELLDVAEKQIFQISNKVSTKDFLPLSQLLKSTFKKISDASETQGDVTGIPCGFGAFDTMTSGLQNGDLLILAGRPAMGKTALALNIAVNAWRSGAGVGVFSLEMPSEQLVLRMIASESGIPLHKIRTGSFGSEEWLEITDVAALLDESQIFIDDSPSITLIELRAKARRLKFKHDVKLLVIDYLQLVTLDQRVENRTQEIATISRGLKALAKELDLPIIALSQLSRSLESRMDKRPMLSDLRESGSIEQDADIVCFVYRDVVYNPETENPSAAEIIIGKQRNGPIGTVNVAFDGAISRFYDVAED